MASPDRFRERLASGLPLLLDAAMGTELDRGGVRTTLPLWSAWALLEAPEAVFAIHGEAVAAGADVLTANTFRTHRRSLAKAGLGERARELTARAVALARRAAGRASREIFVAGSLSPLEDCYRPELAPEESALLAEHLEQAEALASTGVDLILAETHNSVRELSAAVCAARQTRLPVVASMVTDGQGRLLSGEPLDEAAREIGHLSPDAVAINCVPAALLSGDLALVARALPGSPLGAWGNLGPPCDAEQTKFTAEVSPGEYAAFARDWLALGARLVGGCCGTTAAHTAALRAMLDSGSS
ncbi:MAG: homocysteine S-methyltransferase family protein [Thermoanaerobaculia bacterium]